MQPKRVGIVGAGMAGLSCARVLQCNGLAVELFDKGRGPGGRMSTRRVNTPLGEATFDHGAQYFTARDPRFVEAVAAWASEGLVAPWPEAHREAWVGVPGMNAVVRSEADLHSVRFGQQVRSMEQCEDGWYLRIDAERAGPFDIAVIAVPAEQAAPLLSLHDFDMARAALHARSNPCWTGLFAFGEKVPTDLNLFRNKGIIAWAARNCAKPGREGPESWVVQAQPSWTEEHCEDAPEEVTATLLDAFAEQIGAALPTPVVATAHRWRFAMSNGTGAEALWNPHMNLAACGDWLIGPRVEAAWLSGQILGHQILGSIGAQHVSGSLA